MTKELSLDDVRLDGGTQPRAELSDEVIQQIADALEDGQKIPAVDVFYDGDQNWLADGFHRFHAHKRAGSLHIAATIHQGTQLDAQWFSFAANKAHDTNGLKRTNADKKRAVEAALRHPNAEDMSDRMIAAHLGVDHVMVGKYRAKTGGEDHQLNTRTGRDGKQYPASRPTPVMRTLASEIGEDNTEPSTTTSVVDRETGEVLDDVDIVRTKTEHSAPTKGSYESGRAMIDALAEMKNSFASISKLKPKRTMALEVVEAARGLVGVVSATLKTKGKTR